MNYNEKSKKWYQRALDEKDEFIKFLLLYIAFEVVSKGESQIRNIKNKPEAIVKFYSNISKSDLNELKNQLDKQPLQNMLKKGKIIKLESIHDFGNIVEYVITIRHNLVHGDKGVDERRDLEVVMNGNKILLSLVKSLLDIS